MAKERPVLLTVLQFSCTLQFSNTKYSWHMPLSGRVMQYHFKKHKEDGGYWAECIELKGCVTRGSFCDASATDAP